MKTEAKTLERETARQAFHRELEQVRKRLPEDWRMRFFLRYKEYDTAGGGRLVNDVYYLRSTDMGVLERLKELADLFEQEKKG